MKKLSTYDFNEKILVENCEKIDIGNLLKEFSHIYKKEFIKSKLLIDGINVLLTSTKTKNDGERVWFQCPSCNYRASKLYRTPFNSKIGCRYCLNLEYYCRRYSGMGIK